MSSVTYHRHALETAERSLSPFKLGYTYARRGELYRNPHFAGSPEARQFAEGYTAGRKRRIKDGHRKNNNISDTLKAAAADIKRYYGCKTYAVAKRCPECGGKALVRRSEDGVCMECVVKGRKVLS